jgi:hypothetical protein
MLQGWIYSLNDYTVSPLFLLDCVIRQVGNCMNWMCFYTHQCLRSVVA